MKWEYTSFCEYNYECRDENKVWYFTATNVIRDEYTPTDVPENLLSEEEIKKYYYSVSECLDLHGNDGWELVSVVYRWKLLATVLNSQWPLMIRSIPRFPLMEPT